MPSRTTAAAVRGVLEAGGDYGPKEDGSLPDLTPFMDTAYSLVTDVVACASRKGVTLDTDKREIIERWLAAHAYALSDKPLSSKSDGGASGAFSGQTGLALDFTQYGQMAKILDTSGCLINIEKRQVARGFWMGKPYSSQIPYDERS